MAGKIGSRTKKTEAEELQERRMVILDHTKLKPNMPAYQYLKKIAGSCGRDCVSVDFEKKTIIVYDTICLACLTRVKKCPDDAIKVVKLPSNLTSHLAHHYGQNSFKLHQLPMPAPNQVLGILGQNGVGKSTACKILSGHIKPNLGKLESAPTWQDILKYYRGSDLQNFFQDYLEGNLKVSLKPQMDSNFAKFLSGKKMRDLIEKASREQAKTGDGDDLEYSEKVMHILSEMELFHLIDREDCGALSGGEMQRLAIAVACMQPEANVFIFDEPSSFLDVKQRLSATRLIRSLANAKQTYSFNPPSRDGKSVAAGAPTDAPTSEATPNTKPRYVIAIEHDLAILDYMSDHVHCLYGEPGFYGVVAKRAGVRNGINNFLAGYLPSENMRFRQEELTFKISMADGGDDSAAKKEEKGKKDGKDKKDKKGKKDKDGGDEAEDAGGGGAGEMIMHEGYVGYPSMTKVLGGEKEGASTFTLHIEEGGFCKGQIIGMLGQNGTGKSTYMELLAGLYDKKTPKEGAAGEDAAQQFDYECEKISLLGQGCTMSYKKQDYAPKYRRYPGTVRQLLERNITDAFCTDSMFRLLVLRPLGFDDSIPSTSMGGGHEMLDSYVKNLSGGELQRLAIVVCLGTPALVYLLDEPSAGLDCEQRVKVAKVIRKWARDYLGRTVFIIEHDSVMMTATADKVILFSGRPGIEATASSPMGLQEGYNAFLKELNVTYRRDPVNFRPRINKENSQKDKEQKAAGNYYSFDGDDED